MLGMLRAAKNLNDYNLIQEKDGKFKPKHALRRHQFSAGLLHERLPRRYLDNKPLVVITHYLPSARSLDGRYATSDYNCAYASNLDNLVADSNASVWVHGHTHVSKGYWIGNTQIVCNPRGYYGDELNPEFNPELIVEVGT
jgi:Icc-related predicted phosphoesterase